MKHTEFVPEEFSIFAKSPLESAYAETFVYTPSSKEEDGLGHLYVVVEISSNKSKKENAEFVSRLVNVLKNEFYKNTIVTPISALRFSLKRANRFLVEEKTFKTAANLKLGVVVAALKENNLHLSKLGDAAAIILRGTALQHIVAPLKVSPSGTEGLTFRQSGFMFENIVSGEILPADKIVLATNQIHKISETVITQKLQEKELASYIKEDSSGLNTLGFIALYPKGNAPERKPEMLPLIQKTPPSARAGFGIGTPNAAGATVGVLAASKTNIGKKILRRIPRVRMAVVITILAVCVIAITAVALKLRHDSAQNKKEAETLVTDLSDLQGKISSMLDLKNETEAIGLLDAAQTKLARLKELDYFQTTRISLAVEFEKMSQALKKVSTIENIDQIFSLENNSAGSTSSLRAGFDPREIASLKNTIIAFGGNTMYNYNLNKDLGEFKNLDDSVKIAAILPRPESPEKILVISQNKIYDGGAPVVSGVEPEIWSGTLDAAKSDIVQAKIYNNTFYILGGNSMMYKIPFEMSSSTLNLGGLLLWTNKANRGNVGQIGDFAVEGSIFTLTDPMDSDGSFHTIAEMINGDIKNKVDLPEGATKIFTSANHKNVYVLSPREGMIIVFDKNLNIQKRLSHDELKGAKSFFVNSQERIVYFLKGKTVYSFEI